MQPRHLPADKSDVKAYHGKFRAGFSPVPTGNQEHLIATFHDYAPAKANFISACSSPDQDNSIQAVSGAPRAFHSKLRHNEGDYRFQQLRHGPGVYRSPAGDMHPHSAVPMRCPAVSYHLPPPRDSYVDARRIAREQGIWKEDITYVAKFGYSNLVQIIHLLKCMMEKKNPEVVKALSILPPYSRKNPKAFEDFIENTMVRYFGCADSDTAQTCLDRWIESLHHSSAFRNTDFDYTAFKDWLYKQMKRTPQLSAALGIYLSEHTPGSDSWKNFEDTEAHLREDLEDSLASNSKDWHQFLCDFGEQWDMLVKRRGNLLLNVRRVWQEFDEAATCQDLQLPSSSCIPGATLSQPSQPLPKTSWTDRYGEAYESVAWNLRHLYQAQKQAESPKSRSPTRRSLEMDVLKEELFNLQGSRRKPSCTSDNSERVTADELVWNALDLAAVVAASALVEPEDKLVRSGPGETCAHPGILQGVANGGGQQQGTLQTSSHPGFYHAWFYRDLPCGNGRQGTTAYVPVQQPIRELWEQCREIDFSRACATREAIHRPNNRFS